MTSPAFSISKDELLSVGKVLMYVAVSAVLTKLSQLVPSFQLGATGQLVAMGSLNVALKFVNKFVPSTEQPA